MKDSTMGFMEFLKIVMRYAVLLLLLFPFFTQAAVYKCEINGKIKYQEAPCIDGDAEQLQITPPPSKTFKPGVTGIRESERQWLKKRKAERTRRIKYRQKEAARAQAAERQKKQDEQTCNNYKAKEDYYDDLARTGRSSVQKRRYRARADYYAQKGKPYCK